MINRKLVYVKENPTSQTFDKMNNDLMNFVLNPNVPSTNNNHRKIYLTYHPEEHLNRDDIIHHINGNHDDNSKENLMKVTAKQHARLHADMNKK